jgi:hypothetical protein
MQRPNKRPHDSEEPHDTTLIAYPASSSSVARAEALFEIASTKRQRTDEDTAVARGTGHTFDRSIACDNARVQYGDTYNVSYNRATEPESKEDAWSKAMGLLRFPQMDVRRQTVRDAHTGTCGWIFEKSEYKSWCDARQVSLHHGFLWIKSKPGAGKSTLVKFLLDATVQRSPNEAVISFFFNARGDLLERSSEGMYRQLLHQLLAKVKRLESIIRIPEIADLEPLGWPHQMLERLFKKCVLSLGQEHVTCFIDALDECPEEDIRELVDFLEDLGKSVTAKNISFRICLSSRHYPYVTLEKCQHLILDGQEGHQQDIADYIRGKLRLRKSDNTDKIMAAVQKRSKGVFLWVVLVIRILNEENNRGNAHKLKDRLDMIPDGLENLFRDTLSKPGQDDAKVIQILQWMLYARRPLTREELYFGVNTGGIHDRDLELWDRDEIVPEVMDLFILHCSKGLAELTNDKRPKVQFIHESVRDYLFDGGFALLAPEISKNLSGVSHEYLKFSCLRLISSSMVSDNLEEQTGATLMEKFPLLQYALDHVVGHAERACANGIDQEGFVTSFPLSNWSRLSDLMGNLSNIFTIKSKTSLFVAWNAHNLLQIEHNLRAPLLSPAEHYLWISSALFSENFEVLGLVLKRGVAADLKDEDQLSLMRYAVEKATPHILRMLFESGMRLGSAQSSRSLLSQASHTGVPALVRILLDHGARIGSFDADTLYHAAKSGSISIVKMLLDSGASVNIAGEQVAITSIMSMSPTGEHQNAARTSPKQSKDREIKDNFEPSIVAQNTSAATPAEHMTALQYAAAKGHDDMVRLLLERGADPNAVPPSHCKTSTAMYHAALHGHHTTLALFLDNEVWRQTPDSAVWHESLRVAAWNAHPEAIEVLLGNNTGVQVREPAYYGRIVQAAAVGGREEILQVLLDDDTHFRAQCPETYCNALRQAMNLGNDGVVEILRNRGVRLAETELIRLGGLVQGAYLAQMSEVRQLRLSSKLDV